MLPIYTRTTYYDIYTKKNNIKKKEKKERKGGSERKGSIMATMQCSHLHFKRTEKYGTNYYTL
jgi:hypothetical protein